MAEGDSCRRVEQRLKNLEHLVFGNDAAEDYLSIELLLDALVVLYDECCHSTLRKEKTVSDFIEKGIYIKFKVFRELLICLKRARWDHPEHNIERVKQIAKKGVII